MHRLRGAVFYLSGPIDCVESEEDAIGWRQNITGFLHSIGAGVFNPLDKPMSTGVESYQNSKYRHGLKQKGRFDEVRDIMKTVCSDDMRLVDNAHALILYIDKEVHMCGSYVETAWAALEKKPIIVMCRQGKAEVPDFLIGITPHRMFFGSWEEVKDYLYKIHTGEDSDTMKRWRFIEMDKVYKYNPIQ